MCSFTVTQVVEVMLLPPRRRRHHHHHHHRHQQDQSDTQLVNPSEEPDQTLIKVHKSQLLASSSQLEDITLHHPPPSNPLEPPLREDTNLDHPQLDQDQSEEVTKLDQPQLDQDQLEEVINPDQPHLHQSEEDLTRPDQLKLPHREELTKLQDKEPKEDPISPDQSARSR